MKNYSNIAIVVPSFNEENNVQILIGKASRVLKGVRIIIVDDSSKAENKKLKEAIGRNKNVILISRFKKLGRGTAVVR